MDNKSQGNEWILRLLCVVSSVLKQWRIIIIVVCLFAAVFDVIQTITYSPTYQSKAVVAILDGDGKGLDGDSTIKGNQTIQYFLNSSMMKKQVNQPLKYCYVHYKKRTTLSLIPVCRNYIPCM